MEITWNELGEWIVSYAHNQTIYKELNVTSVSENITIEPGFEYIIKSTSYSSNANEDKTDSTDTSEQDDQIPLTNILMILLIASLVIYSVFKASNKKK